MLDYRIQTFLTLYNEMNYRKTAEKLNMTQPGVTQHIHYLEKHYGVKLFEYDGRVLKRTGNAEVLKRYADSIQTEELVLQESFAPADRLHLNVGATKTIGEFVMIPSVRRFLADEQHSLQLTIDNTEKLLQMLERSELDFAVIEGVFDKAKYGYHLFKKEKFLGICSAEHPFASKTVSLQEVFRENLVVREKGSGTRMLLEQAIRDRGFSLETFARCISISNFMVISELVAKDHMITFAYEPVAQHHPGLRTFEVEDMRISGEFNFVYCNERIARERIETFFL